MSKFLYLTDFWGECGQEIVAVDDISTIEEYWEIDGQAPFGPAHRDETREGGSIILMKSSNRDPNNGTCVKESPEEIRKLLSLLDGVQVI